MVARFCVFFEGRNEVGIGRCDFNVLLGCCGCAFDLSIVWEDDGLMKCVLEKD